MIYLDTSAAVKALIEEPETASVRALLEGEHDVISSRLLAVELNAVVDRRGLRAVDARALIDRVAIVRLSDDIAQRAIDLRSGLRTLDALHLATMLYLGPLVVTCLSFDDELTAGALRHGIPAHPLV